MISFSRGSSRPRDQTCISCTGSLFTTETPRKPLFQNCQYIKCESEDFSKLNHRKVKGIFTLWKTDCIPVQGTVLGGGRWVSFEDLRPGEFCCKTVLYILKWAWSLGWPHSIFYQYIFCYIAVECYMALFLNQIQVTLHQLVKANFKLALWGTACQSITVFQNVSIFMKNIISVFIYFYESMIGILWSEVFLGENPEAV